MIVIARCTLFTPDFFHSPLDWESDYLMELRGECSHRVDLWPTKGHIVGKKAIEYNKCDVEVDSSSVNWQGDIPQCELLLFVEPDEEREVVVNVRFFYF